MKSPREPGRRPWPAVEAQAGPSAEEGGEAGKPALPQDAQEDPAGEALPEPRHPCRRQDDHALLFSCQVC